MLCIVRDYNKGLFLRNSLLVVMLPPLCDPNPMSPRDEESKPKHIIHLSIYVFHFVSNFFFWQKIPFVSFLDPVVSISESVKLQSYNNADVANL